MGRAPDGRGEAEWGEDGVGVGWTEADGSRGSAAIPKDDYDRYLAAGKIRSSPVFTLRTII